MDNGGWGWRRVLLAGRGRPWRSSVVVGVRRLPADRATSTDEAAGPRHHGAGRGARGRTGTRVPRCSRRLRPRARGAQVGRGLARCDSRTATTRRCATRLAAWLAGHRRGDAAARRSSRTSATPSEERGSPTSCVKAIESRLGGRRQRRLRHRGRRPRTGGYQFGTDLMLEDRRRPGRRYLIGHRGGRGQECDPAGPGWTGRGTLYRGPRRATLGMPDAHHETSCTMRNKSSAATMARLLEHARYEVLPTASTEDKLLEHVPRDRTITVTASPGKGLEATLDLAERLTGHGYVAVPHLAARMISGRAELEEIAARLTGKGITRDLRARRRRRAGGRLPGLARRCSRTSRRWGTRSTRSASPATPSRTRPSTTTSPCRRCGTSATTRRTSSAT